MTRASIAHDTNVTTSRRQRRCKRNSTELHRTRKDSTQNDLNLFYGRRDKKVCGMAIILLLSALQATTLLVTASPDDDEIAGLPAEDANPGTEHPQTLRQLTSEEEDEIELYLEWKRFLQIDGETVETISPELKNMTNVPTIIDTEIPQETETPSAAPTSSAAPSKVTDMPSEFPTATVSPSISPTRTWSPSNTPSISNAPSLSPQPTDLPSSVPTLEPTWTPSLLPSLEPTVSGQPTITPRPTASSSPTLSYRPTPVPTSEFPSQVPTSSVLPSTAPSFHPSPFPTSSSMPSMTPSLSLSPTISPMPTTSPSAPPTNLPSLMPSQPSEFPSMLPTIVLEEPFAADKVFMILDGLPALLEEDEIQLWQTVTSQHIIDYWTTLRIEHPGDTPLFVGEVNTTLYDQFVVEQTSIIADDGDEVVVAQMLYSQSFSYGVFGDNDPPLESEILQYYLVLLPFVTNSYEYSTALTESLNLTNFVLVTQIDAGDPPAPAPTPPQSGLSMAAVRAISASIVVGACLIVAFLLYDRKRKDGGRFPSDSDSDYEESRHRRRRGMDTMEFDNAGQPVDWTNPYSDAAANAAAAVVVRSGTGVGTAGSGGGTAGNRSGATSVSSRDGSHSGEMPVGPLARATSIRSMPGIGTMNSGTSGTGSTAGSGSMGPSPPPNAFGSRGGPPGRRSEPASQRGTSMGDLPPLAPGGTSLHNSSYINSGIGRTSGGPGRSPFMFGSSPSVPQRGMNIRGTSVTDTEITDLTYSDFQSDGRGSDVANLSHLPPISDEPLGYPDRPEHSSMPFSPLHIPDEEAMGMAGRLSPPSSPIPSVLDLASDIQSPMMTGFDLQIEELE